MFTLPFIGGASVCIGWATVRPGVDIATVEAAYLEELERLASERADRGRARPREGPIEADELGALARVEERADRLSMYATLCDDPGMINTLLPRYLSVTAEQIRDAARDVFRADNRVVLTYVPAGRRRRRDRGEAAMTADDEAAYARPARSSPSDRARQARPYDFPFTARSPRQRPARHRDADARPGARVGLARPSARRGRRAAGARRRDRPGGPRPHRGHRASATRSRSTRPPSASARRSTPRPAGTRRPPGSTSRPAGWSPPSSCSPRSSAARRSRPPRSSGCATSGSPTCSRRRPTRAAGPTRRTSSTIYAPSSPYHRPAGGTAETVAHARRRASCGPSTSGHSSPARVDVVVAGDVDPATRSLAIVERLFGDWAPRR